MVDLLPLHAMASRDLTMTPSRVVKLCPAMAAGPSCHWHADMYEATFLIQAHMTCREEELRTAHTVFQSTFDREKRREAERKAELERQRRVEVPAP